MDPWVGKIPWRRERLLTPYSGLENSTGGIVNGVTKDTTERLSLWASLVAQLVKNSPAMQETPFQFLGWEDSPENTCSSILGLPWWLSW